MKHKLTLFPILAMLATCGGSQPALPQGNKVSVHQNLTAEETKSLDTGVNQIKVGPDLITYTKIVTSEPVESKNGMLQHYRMTFDTGNVPLCSDDPNWDKPMTEYKPRGEDGNPDCLSLALLGALLSEKTFTHYPLTETMSHGRNAVEFNNLAGLNFEATFMMASGRSTTFDVSTGEVIRTTESRAEAK
jgi:hypothetical protein